MVYRPTWQRDKRFPCIHSCWTILYVRKNMNQTNAIPIATAIKLTVRRTRTDGPASACRASVGVSIITPFFFLTMVIPHVSCRHQAGGLSIVP
jgi:hypothetical protein